MDLLRKKAIQQETEYRDQIVAHGEVMNTFKIEEQVEWLETVRKSIEASSGDLILGKWQEPPVGSICEGGQISS